MSAEVYLADTSVYVLRERQPSVRERVDRLLVDGRLACCRITAIEFLNNAPDPRSYETTWRALNGQRWIDVTGAAVDRAGEVHRLLSRKSQHRQFSVPDLIIAATAELSGVTVLHYDHDYDRIAAATDQPVEWVVPRGSL
jgi:predicted nucleic acid-binding protein